MQTPDGDLPNGQPLSPTYENGTERAAIPSELPPDDPRFHRDAVPLPADLRTPLTGFDLLILLAFYFIAGTAIAAIVAAIAIGVFGVPRETLLDSSGAKAVVIILSQVLLSGAVLVLLYGMVRSRGTEDFWPSVGWRGLPRIGSSRAATIARFVLGGVVLAIVNGWVGSHVDRNIVVPMEELVRDRRSILLLTGLGLLVAPFFEETLFRGCIYPVIARRWGTGVGVLATGILFGTAHAPQLWPAYAQISLLMFVGIVLTYFRARTGTVAASYLVHLGYNTLLFAILYFVSNGLRHLPS